MKLLHTLKASTLVAALIICIPANAGEITSSQMDAVSLFALTDGYTQSHKDNFDLLTEDDSDSHTYQLVAGKRYKFVGACDEDCDDLDLEIYDRNGRLIDIDMSTDDLPVVDFRAPYTGSYTLKVSLEDCSALICAYRVRAFSR